MRRIYEPRDLLRRVARRLGRPTGVPDFSAFSWNKECSSFVRREEIIIPFVASERASSVRKLILSIAPWTNALASQLLRNSGIEILLGISCDAVIY